MPFSLYARLRHRYGPKDDGLTRREMLRASLAASAGLLLSGPGYAFAQASRSSGRRVVVVGAGFSGLACAHELKTAGYDVTVVEARGRVGGRVLSFSDLVPGKNVEGGAELIGSNHPTWVGYRERFKLEFLDVTEDESLAAPIVIGGQRISDADAEAIWKEMDESHAPMIKDAANVNEDEPWKTPNAESLDRKSTAEWIAGLGCSERGKKILTSEWTGNNAIDTLRQSYLGNLTQVKGGGLDKYWTESEVYRCKGGNQQLATKLAESIGEDRIRLKLPVTEIQINEKAVIVKCADGRTLECDDVILSVAPTVWSKIKVTPELRRGLAPQMGSAIKYLAATRKRFWLDEKLSPYSATDGDISMTWEGTDNQPGDDGALLVAFSGGTPSDHCRAQPEAARDGFYQKEMEKLYPGFGSNFVKSRFMDWPSDPWTLAGYSFPAPGQVTKFGPFLSKPHAERLHLCGEYTCYKFVGYMEGALNSGAALARRLAVAHGVVKP